jgi:hypothetical protein
LASVYTWRRVCHCFWWAFWSRNVTHIEETLSWSKWIRERNNNINLYFVEPTNQEQWETTIRNKQQVFDLLLKHPKKVEDKMNKPRKEETKNCHIMHDVCLLGPFYSCQITIILTGVYLSIIILYIPIISSFQSLCILSFLTNFYNISDVETWVWCQY